MSISFTELINPYDCEFSFGCLLKMNIFNSFAYHAGLNENVCYVLMLLCMQVVAVISTSKNAIFQENQVKSIYQPHSEADSQIPTPPKCCAPGEWLQHLSLETVNNCVDLPSNINNITLESSYNRQFSKFGIIYEPVCNTSESMEAWTRSNAKDFRYNSEDNTVFNLATKTNFKILCGDYINLNNSYSAFVNYDNVEEFKNLQYNTIGIILCDIWEPTLAEKISYLLSTYGLGLSIFFLAATFYIYLTTPKLRRKLQGKCVLCYLAALIFGFSSYLWNVILGENDEPSNFCFFTAFLSQYCLLSMFTWLTVICTNLSNIMVAPTPKNSDSRKFMVYCLFGWGLPVSMSLATFTASRLDKEHYFKVDFDVACWFYPKEDRSYWLQPEFIYFNSYVSLTLLINACLFIRTTYTLISSDCYWKKLEGGQRHGASKNRFRRYLKLFLVMGSTWVLGSISFNMYFTMEASQLFLIMIDLLTISQDIIIFIVFVCISRNEKLRMKRLDLKQNLSPKTSIEQSF